MRQQRRPTGAWAVVGFAGLLVALSSGCATDYVARTRDVRQAYETGDYPGALEKLDKELKEGQHEDKLLVLLDRGMLLHSSGRYEESIQALREAERLADELDVVSITEEASTFLSNERERAYRGEDFEKLMINVLQALNYAALGKDEDALVEVRRVNLRLGKMVTEEKKPYEQLAIARYLGGTLWEDQREWDSAFIDYQKAFELNPSLGHLAGPLLRLAKKTGRDDAYQKLKATFPDADEAPLGPAEGEVLVVVESGRAPEKVSSRRQTGNPSLNLVVVPMFQDRWSNVQATVRAGEQERSAVTVTSLEDVGRKHLEDRVGRLIAKSLATTAVKAGIAAGAGVLTKSEEAGALAFYLLTLTNEADVRSWMSLPAEFQLARLRLPAGKHTVTVQSGSVTTQHEVDVQPGRIRVLPVRRP